MQVSSSVCPHLYEHVPESDPAQQRAGLRVCKHAQAVRPVPLEVRKEVVLGGQRQPHVPREDHLHGWEVAAEAIPVLQCRAATPADVTGLQGRQMQSSFNLNDCSTRDEP